uniref:GDNF family receptor alpha-4-like isoform X2 n=1 Tax=Myxine glutinosa TaxID=7769 RepID=UPI00358E7916
MDRIFVLTIATVGTAALIGVGHCAASSESDSVSRRTSHFDTMLGAGRPQYQTDTVLRAGPHQYQTDSMLRAGPPPYQTDSMLRAGPHPYQTDSMLRAGPPPYQTDSMLRAGAHPYQTDSMLRAGPPPYQADSMLRAGPPPYQADSLLRTGPPPYQTDCVRGQELCMADTVCSSSLRTMRQCVAGSGDLLALKECVAAVEALQASALYYCRCRRGMRREKSCLRIYWVINEGLARGDDLFENSPYEPTSYLSQALATGRPANPTSGNACMAAAMACNMEEACTKYKTEYVQACAPRGDSCNRRRCHSALRRFFDRVPANSSHGMLFCPCHEYACTERKRKTIVPSCSYADREKINCLSLHRSCKSNFVCRSRLADFFTNCRASSHSRTACYHDNYAACLMAYTGLVGTAMTPNYIDTSSLTVAPWCTCSKSGNQRDDCDSFLQLFTRNICLRNAMQAFGNGSELGKGGSRLSPVATVPTTLREDDRREFSYEDLSESREEMLDSEENVIPPLHNDDASNSQADRKQSLAGHQASSPDPNMAPRSAMPVLCPLGLLTLPLLLLPL